MKKIISILFILFLFAKFVTFGQAIRVFSDDPAVYIEEITSIMTKSKTATSIAAFEKFNVYFRSGAFSEEEQLSIIHLSNLLLKKRARANPHFLNFILVLNSFKEKAMSSDNFRAWYQGSSLVLEDNKYPINNINQFFINTTQLIQNNILFKSSPATWKSTSSDVKFVFDKTLKYIIPKADLICYAQKDSIIIHQTAGILDPLKTSWQGTGGKVTWERSGYGESEVYVLLDQYKIDLKKPGYKADSVLFFHTKYFTEALSGNLEDRVKKINNISNVSFPVFESFEQRFFIKNIYPGIDYEGGFSMAGSTINGVGDSRTNSILKFYKNDTVRLSVSAASFQFKKDRISNSNAAVAFYLENDSIFHSNISFTYNVPKKEVSLFKTDDHMTFAPYFNSYHKIDMNFDLLIWNIDDPLVRITMPRGATIGKARFKSSNYFNKTHFLKMQGMDNIHPLFALKKFAEWYYSDEFEVVELAKWLKMPESKVQHLIVRLSTEGFVFYDPETNIVRIKPQLNDYLDAFGGDIDYDVIDFISNTKSPQNNAILNLNNNELAIFGIPRIFISDSQNVEILPTGNKIVLKKDRDFDFGGRVQAGLLTFYGNDFTFKYDSFRIHLNNIDSLNLAIIGDEVDIYGNRSIKKIRNNIQNITGDLLIDAPENKSGLKSIPQYPVFKSTTNAFVYYDVTEGIDSTLYPRDEFYYQLNPFEISDMTNLQADDLNLGGEYYCGDIFPVLKQNLSVNQDNSLGFVFEPPPEGIPTYGGKATFYDQILLSNKGIEGTGKLEYLTSTSRSENFQFYPDSMIAETAQFNMAKDSIAAKFPIIASYDASLKWYPNDDEFYSYRKEEDFTVFNDQVFYTGNLLLKPNGLVGLGGSMLIDEAEISSRTFDYGNIYFHCDTSDIKFKSESSLDYSLIAKNFITDVNIENQAIFTSQIDTVPLYFPEKNYLSSADMLVWDIYQKSITIINNDKRNDIYKLNSIIHEEDWLIVPAYASTDPLTDTLGFASDTVLLQLEDYRLTATNIESLEIADIQIKPYDKTLTLERNGNLRGFTDALIIANEAHEIEADNIVVTSKNDYYGSGYYVYTDIDNYQQRILFSEIKLNDEGHTIASGTIVEADSFKLSPWFSFEGKVSLNAEKEFLHFSGGTRLNHNCSSIGHNGISFNTEIDPEDVRIPVSDKPASISGNTLYNGVFITNTNTEVYSSFFSKRKNYSDIPIATADGFLIFDKEKSQYTITGVHKLVDYFQPDNMITFDNNYCRVYGEGKIDLGVDYGQIKLTSVGNVSHNIETNDVDLDILLGIDFFFSEDALLSMAHDLNSIPTLKPINLSSNTYKLGLIQLDGGNLQEQKEDELILVVTSQNVPPKLRRTIQFSDLKLKWHEESLSYQSVGKIGIGNIHGTPSNRLVDGLVEIQKKGGGDILDIFLQIDERTWYYFNYTPGRMQAASSNPDFQDILANLGEGKRRIKPHGTETPYVYMVAANRQVVNFRKKYRLMLDDAAAAAAVGTE